MFKSQERPPVLFATALPTTFKTSPSSTRRARGRPARVNRGAWWWLHGTEPERLKLHMKHQEKFDASPARPRGTGQGRLLRPRGRAGARRAEASRNAAALRHVEAGGARRPAVPRRVGTAYEGESLLAENSAPVGSPVQDGYPEFTVALLEKFGWAGELTPSERETILDVARRMFEPRRPRRARPRRRPTRPRASRIR